MSSTGRVPAEAFNKRCRSSVHTQTEEEEEKQEGEKKESERRSQGPERERERARGQILFAVSPDPARHHNKR